MRRRAGVSGRRSAEVKVRERQKERLRVQELNQVTGTPLQSRR